MKVKELISILNLVNREEEVLMYNDEWDCVDTIDKFVLIKEGVCLLNEIHDDEWVLNREGR